MSLRTEDRARTCPVNSHNEWDPLEEVIVGRVTGAAMPRMHVAMKGAIPHDLWPMLEQAGQPYAAEQIELADRQLEALVSILKQAGVVVQRPREVDYNVAFGSPHWRSQTGFSSANPRDVMMVVGDAIVEATMSWPARYFEIFAYRDLIKDYFRRGARWISGPKPELADPLYDPDYVPPHKGEPMRFVTTEWEPIFDAADFARCGTDIFVQRSTTTNQAGIEWVRRHLGERYRVHELATLARQPMHLDTTFVPLAPGRVLINPTYLDTTRLPSVCHRWELLECPPMLRDPSHPLGESMASVYLGMNVLSLDERRVIVEQFQAPLIEKLKAWGFEPVPCPFAHYAWFGGGFHCATADIRRRGALQSYA